MHVGVRSPCALTPRWTVVEFSHRAGRRYERQLKAEDALDGGQRQAVLGKALPHDETGGVD